MEVEEWGDVVGVVEDGWVEKWLVMLGKMVEVVVVSSN